MVFRWLAKNEARYSALIIETNRCTRFFDELDLEGAYRVSPPWASKVFYINIKIIRYFLYFCLKEFSSSGPTLVSAWIYAMQKYAQVNRIVIFYFAPKPFFLKIAKLDSDVSVHCIYPSLVTDNKNISIHHNIFHYVHDESDVARLVARNVNLKNIIVTGSPYLSLYKRFLKGKEVVKKYDICLISQVVVELFRKDKSQYHHKVDKAFRKLLETINLLYKNYPFYGSLCIALRLFHSKEEREREKSYFLNILDCVKVDFVENTPESYSSYYTMEQSMVGLTLNSTVAYDMQYIGVKSIYAIDSDITHRPSKKDIEYHFQNGSPDELFKILKEFTADFNKSSPPLSSANQYNSIELIRGLLNT